MRGGKVGTVRAGTAADNKGPCRARGAGGVGPSCKLYLPSARAERRADCRSSPPSFGEEVEKVLEVRRASAPLEGPGRSQPDGLGSAVSGCWSESVCVWAPGAGVSLPLKKNKTKRVWGELRPRPVSPVRRAGCREHCGGAGLAGGFGPQAARGPSPCRAEAAAERTNPAEEPRWSSCFCGLRRGNRAVMFVPSCLLRFECVNMNYSCSRRRVCNLRRGVLFSAGLTNMQTTSNLVFTLLEYMVCLKGKWLFSYMREKMRKHKQSLTISLRIGVKTLILQPHLSSS
ncbi:uncharacterized protein [Sylvia atricapilla]|uniref:uncharacterized protein n=1 Tax=Sylvia atricapilla TaxID=48155 RepID=UPI003394FF3A